MKHKAIEATEFVSTSDKRLKKNIQALEDNSKLLMKLKPVTFQWKNQKKEKTIKGFIAQEVQEIFPDIIHTNSEKFLSIDYNQMIPMMIQQIQFLTKEIETLKNKQKNLSQS
tara:strand:+ start:564 stop:899 length:336 start_codon:yes stop_codon:yes gene_type:complete